MTPEDFVLMLNMGWSLREIADQAHLSVREIERMIVSQVREERIIAKLVSSSWA